ncbi:MAG: caspase family protein [Xanthobacteraceae bacterium]
MRGLHSLAASTLVACLLAAGSVTLGLAQSQADILQCNDTATNNERSIAACTRVIGDRRSTSTTLANALIRRANAYIIQRNFDLALQDADAASRIVPENSIGPYMRGKIYAAKGDHDRAIDAFSEAYRIDPKSFIIISSRGQEYLNAGNYDRAIADLDDALKLNAKDSWSYNARAMAFENKGDFDHAVRDYNAAIQYDAKNISAYINRGAFYRDRGDLDRSLADYDAAIRIDPKSAPAFLHRGKLMRIKGETEKARANFERALELDPTLDTVRVALAELAQGSNASVAANTAVAATTPVPAKATAVATLAPAPAPPPTPAVAAVPEKRVALVIGNGAYQNVATLPNPPNDARAVADALRKIGFTSVRNASNLKRDALLNELKMFAEIAENADWAVVYYAGHGIEIDGVNWLIPVDAALKTDRDVQFEAVPVDQVLGAVDGVKKLALVVLDACRDNPFAAQMRSTSATRSIGRGLAPIEPRRGTLVAYAAKHGEVALDGADGNSPFVTSLVRRIQTPGVEINKVFRLVRDDVLDATNSRQEPFIYGTLPAQDFYFAGK